MKTSITCLVYGDEENVVHDAELLREILGRQGTRLLIDVVAEYYGETANKFGLSDVERQRLINGAIADMRDAVTERV